LIDHRKYKYCVSRDEDYVPAETVVRETAIRKMQFILMEIVNDMGIQKGTFWEWLTTLLYAFAVIWLRMAIHYLGQYVFLKVVDAPVTDIELKWYKIKLEYSYWNMYQQLGMIISGSLANTIAFCFLIMVCHLSNTYIFCFPVRFCKLIAWFGLATCLDFVFINIIDMANQDTDGDLFKLYNYYQRTESSGFIGLFLTFLVQFALLILNIFIFYNYIISVHMDARIKDIYLRISGLGKGYYIPEDNEISWNYLKQTYCLGEINNNRIVVNKIHVPKSHLSSDTNIAKSYQFQRFINDKAVATDDVYFANEKGQILDVDFLEMKLFRDTTLAGLLEEAPMDSEYEKFTAMRQQATLGGPRGSIQPENDQSHHSRYHSVGGAKKPGMFENSRISTIGGPGGIEDESSFNRRGTVSLVKNLIQNKLKAKGDGGLMSPNDA